MSSNGVHANDEDDGDGPSLRELASKCCKPIDIGTAILPKPLFTLDWDERDDAEFNEDHDSIHDHQLADNGSSNIIDNATIDIANIDLIHNSDNVAKGKNKKIPKITRYAKTVSKEFNSIVIEHHLKWSPLVHSLPGPIHPSHPSHRIGRYDFFHVDSMVDWALQQNLTVKGHVLVWHVTSPPFLNDYTPQQLQQELKRHIFTTMAHFRGRITQWDVVNEALAPDGSLANNIFLLKLGPTYIDQCFRWAHEADPTAFLIYNDNKVEGIDTPKSNAFYMLLKGMKERGVPVHGAGMQAHFNASGTGRSRVPTPISVKRQINRIGKLGLKVNISEMDVRVKALPPNLRQIAQTEIYRDILSAAFSEPMFTGVYLWGFTDRHTWVKHFYNQDEGNGDEEQPLIFDEDYGRKNSYYAVRDSLSSIALGGTVGGRLVSYHDGDDDSSKPWGHLWMPNEPESEPGPKLDATTTDVTISGDSRPDWLQFDS